MAYTVPTIAEFKTRFNRDFSYGTSLTTVTDTDITNAFADTAVNFNPDFWDSQANYSTGYLLLTAHFLVTNIRASSQGIQGQYEWLVQSKGVGSVSEGLAIPERIMKNPYFAMLSKTNYGAKYLMLILPMLCGQILPVLGGTQA